MSKALALARHFHRAGYRVIGITSPRYRHTPAHCSRAFERIHVLPDARREPDAYLSALERILSTENVDWFVPICAPATEQLDARAKDRLEEKGICRVFHFDEAITRRLGDKFAFAQWAAYLGLPVPDTRLVTGLEQVMAFQTPPNKPYLLKRIRYDPAGRTRPLLLPLPTVEAVRDAVSGLDISPETPWVLQELIEGNEYCAHATISNGRIRLYTDSRSSAAQLNYEHVGDERMRGWVERFVSGADLREGQLCFDFMESPDGKMVAIECNPRVHSAITAFYNHPKVTDAYFDPRGTADCIEPLDSALPTYWLHQDLERLARALISALRGGGIEAVRSRLRTIRQGTDVMLNPDDPWPFACVNLHFASSLIDKIVRGGEWSRLEYCIGKIVEPGGD